MSATPNSMEKTWRRGGIGAHETTREWSGMTLVIGSGSGLGILISTLFDPSTYDRNFLMICYNFYITPTAAHSHYPNQIEQSMTNRGYLL
jgi:hypothetical protein